MPTTTPAPTQHRWKFFRTGGLDQVALETAADLLALDQLDQKLWVVLSCPVKGLELDEKTLALIDTDGDGHIHVREVVAAVQWAAARLKQPGHLLNPGSALPLAEIDDATPEGKTILAAAKTILAGVGKSSADTISVDDTTDTAKILAAKAPNGDGIVTLRATTDPDTQALIKDILATVGGVPDRAGGEGIDAAKIATFFAEIESYLKWIDATAGKHVPELGEATAPACVALRAVRAKVDDFFTRCRLAAFDARAIGALNRQETEYLAIAAKDLSISAAEVAAFPLAHVAADAPLPLLQAVNPAWAAALATLHTTVVAPLFGARKTELTAGDWAAITAKFAPFEAWLGSRAASSVEKLGAARVRAIVAGAARARLAELVAQDKALAPEFNAISSVARLVRYHRDLRTLLHNFVNFADFYSPHRWATFQAGTLFLDSRSTELCLRVDGPSPLAAMSKTYITYLDCKRAGGETMKVAACFTQGDSDYLFVGRNGVFYDRRQRDWDATITKIVDNPISVREAFWSPYKKFLRMIEEQVAKRATAADAAATGQLASAAEKAAHLDKTGPTAAPKKIDVGTVAALGVAVGAIGGALGAIATGLAKLNLWQLPLVLVGLILVISLPSVAIAWLKLRQRTVGPLLEANGWAINGRVRINIPFGAALTERATLPANASRSLDDPYEDKEAARRKRGVITLTVLIAFAAIAGWIRWKRVQSGHYFWQPVPAAEVPAPAAPPAPAK